MSEAQRNITEDNGQVWHAETTKVGGGRGAEVETQT